MPTKKKSEEAYTYLINRCEVDFRPGKRQSSFTVYYWMLYRGSSTYKRYMIKIRTPLSSSYDIASKIWKEIKSKHKNLGKKAHGAEEIKRIEKEVETKTASYRESQDLWRGLTHKMYD
jgi:hypothetical protein